MATPHFRHARPVITEVTLCAFPAVGTIGTTVGGTMAERRNAALNARMMATISGCDPDLGIFVERVLVIENSPDRACIRGLKRRVQPGATLLLSHAGAAGQVAVTWVGQPRTERAGVIGLRWLRPDERAIQVPGAMLEGSTEDSDFAVPV